MKKGLILLLLACSSASWAFSQQDLIQTLQQPESVQGEFIQQRFLKNLPKPITTSGTFVLRKNAGLLWQMKTPFASDVRVRQDGIMQWNGSQWVENAKVGQSQQISLFLGLLSGDVTALQSQFDLTLSGKAESWQLTLTPTSLLMKQIFNQIELKGDNVVKSIELHEKQGDRTLIQLQNSRQNQPLAAFAQAALAL
ncbi:hypothetical protein A1D29_01480 [Pasteurellaceae bacterium Orientalotternb1]|nr:hypothetical protein A1D29_01480 [Pasteurellaceae bacterium Orientalotternb1]